MQPSRLFVIAVAAAGLAACAGQRDADRTAAASPTPSPATATAPPLEIAPGDTLPAAPEPPDLATPSPEAPAVAATPSAGGRIDPDTGVRIQEPAAPRGTTRRAQPRSTPTPAPRQQARVDTRGDQPWSDEARREPRPVEPDVEPDGTRDEVGRTPERDADDEGRSRDTRASGQGDEAILIPAGTELAIRLNESLASDTSRPERDVTAELAEDVRINNRVVLPAGSEVLGHVVVAQQSGRVKGRARVVVAFDEIRTRGRSFGIEAWRWDVSAESSKNRDAKIAGGAAAAGAIIGAITGGAKGALKGGMIGGAAGGAAVLATRGAEVQIPAGSGHTLTLRKPLRID